MSQTNEDVVLAPARPEDGADVARLWSTTFEDKFGFVLGERMEDFLAEWLPMSPGVYHDTVVARVDGQAVGFIQADGHAPPDATLVGPLWRLLRREFGIAGGLKRILQFWYATLENRVPPHVLHIFMVGVAPEWRGRGIAWRLLEYAEESACAGGKSHLRLGVVYGNDGAIRLYERFGFALGPLIKLRLGRWALGHAQYYEMIKPIARRTEV